MQANSHTSTSLWGKLSHTHKEAHNPPCMLQCYSCVCNTLYDSPVIYFCVLFCNDCIHAVFPYKMVYCVYLTPVKTDCEKPNAHI